MVEEEELQFHEEYMNEQDPSILHFLLASGDDVWEFLDNGVLFLFGPIDLRQSCPLCRFRASNFVMT